MIFYLKPSVFFFALLLHLCNMGSIVKPAVAVCLSIFFFNEIFQGKHCKACCVAVMTSIIQWMKCCYFTICWTIGDVDGIMAILYYRYFLGELLATWNSNNLFPVDGGGECMGMWFLSSEFVCWSFLLKVQAVLNHVILLLIFYS